MSETRDPEAWRARSRIPRASGSWIGVARVQTATPVADPWTDPAWAEQSWTADIGPGDHWTDETCLDDAPVPEHLDARAWAASMLAAESRHADRLPSARLDRGAVIPAPRSAPAIESDNDAAWSSIDEQNDGTDESPAIAGREYFARRTPLSSGNSENTGRHRAPRALRLVYSADRIEPDAPAQRSAGETYEGPVNRAGGQRGASLPTPTEETTPA